MSHPLNEGPKPPAPTPGTSLDNAPAVATKLLEGYLSRDELAKEIRRSPRTIDRWHTMREGPPRVRMGRTIFYKVDSVRKWLREKEEESPSRTKRVRRRSLLSKQEG